MASKDILRRLSLLQELDVSILAIEAGLAELQGSRPYHPRHFVYLLLLSTGVERLAKIVLHLRAFERTGAFLSGKVMRTYGHDVAKLCNAVATACFTQAYLVRPVAKQDLEFIRQDATFRSILVLLADFAKDGRYVYMDGISKPEVTADWPKRWNELEAETMQPGEHARLYLDGKEKKAKRHANRVLTAHFERYVRALSRLFVFGVLANQGRVVSPAVSQYSRLEDEELGNRDYCRP